MEPSKLAQGPYTKEDFLSRRTVECADAAVDEFFETMLGLTAQPLTPVDVSAPTVQELDELAARVHFTGSMSGTCEVRMTPPAAGLLASILLGVPIDEADESIVDAVAEACNIIGGGWKNRTFILSSRCTLSPPTIFSGSGEAAPSDAQLCRIYVFSGHSFRVILTQVDTPAA